MSLSTTTVKKLFWSLSNRFEMRSEEPPLALWSRIRTNDMVVHFLKPRIHGSPCLSKVYLPTSRIYWGDNSSQGSGTSRTWPILRDMQMHFLLPPFARAHISAIMAFIRLTATYAFCWHTYLTFAGRLTRVLKFSELLLPPPERHRNHIIMMRFHSDSGPQNQVASYL